MTEQKDIKDLIEIVDLGFAVEKAVVDIFVGGFKAEKLGELLNVIPAIGPAFDNVKDIKLELADLSGDEVAQLAAHVVAKGAMPEKAAAIVGKSLSVGFAVYDLIKAIKA